jgi:hypothetical protein
MEVVGSGNSSYYAKKGSIRHESSCDTDNVVFNGLPLILHIEQQEQKE